jgi:hypothetical protein
VRRLEARFFSIDGLKQKMKSAVKPAHSKTADRDVGAPIV